MHAVSMVIQHCLELYLSTNASVSGFRGRRELVDGFSNVLVGCWISFLGRTMARYVCLIGIFVSTLTDQYLNSDLALCVLL